MNKILEKLSSFTHLQSSSYKKEQKESDEKTIIVQIQYDGDSTLEIKIPEDCKKSLTCQWLLDEATREINKSPTNLNLLEESKSIVTLKTKNNNYAVDHLLNNPTQSLQFLKTGTVLQPYYGSTEESLEEFDNKVELNDFDIETKLGHGAFSTVYLGNFTTHLQMPYGN